MFTKKIFINVLYFVVFCYLFLYFCYKCKFIKRRSKDIKRSRRRNFWVFLAKSLKNRSKNFWNVFRYLKFQSVTELCVQLYYISLHETYTCNFIPIANFRRQFRERCPESSPLMQWNSVHVNCVSRAFCYQKKEKEKDTIVLT